MFELKDGKLIITTRTLTAVMEKGFITSLKSRAGEEFIASFDPAGYTALQLVYRGNESVPVSSGDTVKEEIFLCGAHRAEIRYRSWHADGNIFLTEDEETGELVIEPSAYSSRPGVRSCRWNVHGLRADMDLILPLYQGACMKPDDPALRNLRIPWPMQWEAGLWIMQGRSSGFWMHCEDTQARFKTLSTTLEGDPFSVGMESENYGPIDGELSAGGIAWRFNVYEGGWKVPAGIYRDWYREAFRTSKIVRPDFMEDVKFALSWCPTDIGLLKALEKKVDPKKTILHLNNWRPFIYDQDYPVFTPTPEARDFVSYCREKGFHVMPHCSSMEIDPSRSDFFPQFSDFTVRELETGKLLGWSWVNGSAELGVPNSNMSLTNNKAYNVMTKIHTNLPMWQSVLREQIGAAVTAMDLEGVFIDVTLCLYNSTRSLVNGLPTTLGLIRECRYLETLGNGQPLVIGGEGLNEINAQGITFGQAHIFGFSNDAGVLRRTGNVGLNAFLFDGLSRSFGYSGLDGADELSRVRMETYTEKGVIPTVTVNSAEEIEHPNQGVAAMIEMANS